MTQNQRILNWLKSRHKLTPLDAMNKWGIQRLGARIYELKNQGHKIKSEMVSVYNRFGDKCTVASYSLTK